MHPDGLSVGAWDPSNAESLIRYTVKKGYDIHGWELGKDYSILHFVYFHKILVNYEFYAKHVYKTMLLHRPNLSVIFFVSPNRPQVSKVFLSFLNFVPV